MNDSEREFLKTTRRRLRINRHRLDDELETQSEVQDQIAEHRSAMEQRMVEAKNDLGKVEASLTEDFRTQEKSTRDTVEAKVQRHPERARAWQRFIDAQRDYREFDGLLDSWKSRAKDIHELGRLFGAQYWTKNSIQGARDERAASERYERPNTRRTTDPLLRSKEDYETVGRRIRERAE